MLVVFKNAPLASKTMTRLFGLFNLTEGADAFVEVVYASQQVKELLIRLLFWQLCVLRFDPNSIDVGEKGNSCQG